MKNIYIIPNSLIIIYYDYDNLSINMYCKWNIMYAKLWI